ELVDPAASHVRAEVHADAARSVNEDVLDDRGRVVGMADATRRVDEGVAVGADQLDTPLPLVGAEGDGAADDRELLQPVVVAVAAARGDDRARGADPRRCVDVRGASTLAYEHDARIEVP